VVLKMQGGKLETIARSRIEFMKASELSMMPEQLEKQIKPQEIADLFAYLTLDRPPADPEARRMAGVYEIVPRETTEPREFAAIISEVAPGFNTSAVGEGGVALLAEHMGRQTVVRTHPLDRRRACVLTGKFHLPLGLKSRLELAVGHHPQGDWQLIVKVNGETLHDAIVGPKTASNGWAEHTVDLSKFAGETVTIDLHNHPNDWSNEFAFWGKAEVVSE
jgi:hypothetical protein